MTLLQTSGQAQQWMELTAWAVAIGIVIALFAAVAAVRYRGIDAEQRRQLYAIRPQLFDAEPTTMTIDEGGMSGLDPRVRTAITDRDAIEAELRVRDALRTLVITVRAALPNAPPLAVRGALEGTILLAAGVLLAASFSWVGWILGPDAEIAIPGLDLLLAWLGWVPGADVLFALALVAVIEGWSILQSIWLGFALWLLGGALILGHIDRVTDEDLSVTLYPDRVKLRDEIIAAGIGIFLAATVPNAVLSTLGFETAGTVIGAIAGLTVFGVVVVSAVANLRRILIHRLHQSERHPRLVAVYLLTRKVFAIIALLSVPLVIWMVSRVIVATGGFWLSSPLLATGIIVIAGVLSWVVLHALFSEEMASLQAAIGRWLRSTRVRGWLFARGVPFTAMFLTFLVAWAFGLSTTVTNVPVLSSVLGLTPAFIAAVTVGIAVRLLTGLWTRARYQFMSLNDREGGHDSVVVNVYPPIEDADGGELFIVRVEEHELAHRDIDQLEHDVSQVVDAAFTGENPPRTESRYYWEDVELGTVDIEQVRRELRGDVESRLLATVRDNDGVEPYVIDEELTEKYPTRAVEAAKARALRRGDLQRQDGQYVLVR